MKDDGGPTWRGVILDTNPCDDDHWIYRLSEKEPPKGKFAWKFFRQPPGVFEAKEVPEAIRKATEQAKRNMIRVPLREGRTLHHDMEGRHGAGKVVMRTAPTGTGIIAGGPMRAVFEMLGIQDVVAKSIGSQNPYNMIRATLDGLKKEASPRMVAQRRGKKVADILRRDEASSPEAVEA